MSANKEEPNAAWEWLWWELLKPEEGEKSSASPDIVRKPGGLYIVPTPEQSHTREDV